MSMHEVVLRRVRDAFWRALLDDMRWLRTLPGAEVCGLGDFVVDWLRREYEDDITRVDLDDPALCERLMGAVNVCIFLRVMVFITNTPPIFPREK